MGGHWHSQRLRLDSASSTSQHSAKHQQCDGAIPPRLVCTFFVISHCCVWELCLSYIYSPQSSGLKNYVIDVDNVCKLIAPWVKLRHSRKQKHCFLCIAIAKRRHFNCFYDVVPNGSVTLALRTASADMGWSGPLLSQTPSLRWVLSSRKSYAWAIFHRVICFPGRCGVRLGMALT